MVSLSGPPRNGRSPGFVQECIICTSSHQNAEALTAKAGFSSFGQCFVGNCDCEIVTEDFGLIPRYVRSDYRCPSIGMHIGYLKTDILPFSDRTFWRSVVRPYTIRFAVTRGID